MADDGAASGFASAMLPHLDAAFRLARWLAPDRATAEDIAQDALLRALTYFASFRGDNPRAWLLRIVRTTALTRAGRRTHEPIGDRHADIPSAAPTPEAALAETEARTLLHRAIAGLPDELRECLVLREFEDLSYRDIAEVTGVPVGTVMSRLHRARRALMDAAI